MNLKQWVRKLWSSTVRGGVHAGSAYIGLAIAHNLEASIPAMNLKALCVVIATSGLLALFKALEESPLPDEIVVTTETTTVKTTQEPKL